MSRVVVAERAFKIYRLCEDSRGGGSVSTIYTRHFTTVDTVCRLPTLSRHTPSPHTHSQSLTRVVACVCRPPAPPHPTPTTAISVMEHQEQQGRLCRQDRDHQQQLEEGTSRHSAQAFHSPARRSLRAHCYRGDPVAARTATQVQRLRRRRSCHSQHSAARLRWQRVTIITLVTTLLIDAAHLRTRGLRHTHPRVTAGTKCYWASLRYLAGGHVGIDGRLRNHR